MKFIPTDEARIKQAKAGKLVKNAEEIRDRLRDQGMYHDDAQRIVDKYTAELRAKRHEYDQALAVAVERVRAASVVWGAGA